MKTLNLVFVLALLASSAAAARLTPSDKSLADQKNYLSFGGVGSYAGVGNNGIPYGGVGGAVGTGGLVGGPPLRAVGGIIGTGPDGRLVGVGGVYPGGVGTIGGVGGASPAHP